jgi:conjugative relaxase-like TrwC/TraI family protein
MLNIGKLAAGPGCGRYYVDQVAQGREDYYAGEGEAPGDWLGSGAALLGLSGEVDAEGIVRLLDGRDPATGDRLRESSASDAVAGFDLTFRAPKSVGILFGIAEPEVVRDVVAAHEAAVGQAMGYLEREACRARRGRGGAIVVAGRGLVAAAFRHRSSRAGDPLLHTHVVVANVTQGPDDRWTALHGQLLFRHAKTAGYLYQSALRAELCERLPVRWNAVEQGTADLAGIPRPVIEHFSQRRAEILEHMAARGERSAWAAQVATLETRRRKEYGVPVDRLREEWRARAAEHGLDRFQLRRMFRQPPERPVDEAHLIERISRRLESPDGLTRDQSRFTRREVVEAFAEASRGGASVLEVEERATAFVGRAHVVSLGSGRGERQYTTGELLDIEHDLLAGADSRRATGAGVADANAVEAALAAQPTLSDEQRALVVTLTRSGDGVEVVRAAAGTGKTFALGAAVDAWRSSGTPVLGCGLSARAAFELRDQTGIDATTIARLRQALDGGAELAGGAVLIVDEAGMVGTRDLAVLAAAAQCSQAKLVLVGDDRQLPEIQAGGAFAALALRVGAVELQDVRRQREPWDRAALADLHGGNVEAFARAYLDHGRLVAAPSAEAARGAMVDDWCATDESGATALMIAHRRRDVADLNARARERMRALGRLGPDVLVAGEHAFAVGDRVVATRNDRALGVVNGQTGVVAGLRSGQLEVRFDGARWVLMPERYVFDGHLDHGYATTAHRAQGATVDRAFVLGSDELYREWGYTALSRHRDAARFYIAATPTYLNQPPAPLESGDDVALSVARALDGSRAKRLAGDDVPERQAVQRRLDGVDQRLATLQRERSGLGWRRRGRRAELDEQIAECRDERRRWQLEGKRIVQPPAPAEPTLRPARDPLAGLERPHRREHQPGFGRDL